MKSMTILGLTIALALASVARADHHDMKPYVGSTEFEQLKSLAGIWTGTSSMEDKDVTVTVEYKVTSAGSAIVETIFGGTPKEMVTVYHDGDDGKVSLTHYCMLQNRPELNWTGTEGKTLNFALSRSCSLHGSGAAHMHSLALTIENSDKIVQRWAMWKDGAEAMATEIALTRAES
jgi:hypothetical protein